VDNQRHLSSHPLVKEALITVGASYLVSSAVTARILERDTATEAPEFMQPVHVVARSSRSRSHLVLTSDSAGGAADILRTMSSSDVSWIWRTFANSF